MSTIVEQPAQISINAVQSYLHTKVSPRDFLDRMRLQMIAVEALHAIRVKSRYGRTTTWMHEAVTKHRHPVNHLH